MPKLVGNGGDLVRPAGGCMSYGLVFEEETYMIVQAEARAEGRTVEEYVLEGVLLALREARTQQRGLSGEAFKEVRERAITEIVELCPGKSLGEISQWFPMDFDEVRERVAEEALLGGAGRAPQFASKVPRHGRGPRGERGARRGRK